MSFPYKTVVVIGATSGIGRALAERMIANGVFVIGVGRRRERLDALVAEHGPDKAAAAPFDITDLAGLAAWVQGLVAAYPAIDAVVLNAGIQRPLDFTRPEAIDLGRVQHELATNYTAYVALAAGFLPHLRARAPRPAALVAVSSGLALVPMPRCANYCATKAALHSLCWSLRAQLAADAASRHVRVVEILPPAVQTELHAQQPDLVARGWADIGIPLAQFTDEAWAGLTAGLDEIPVGPAKERWALEEGRQQAFEDMVKAVGTK